VTEEVLSRVLPQNTALWPGAVIPLNIGVMALCSKKKEGPKSAKLALHCDNVGTTYISWDGRATWTNVGTVSEWEEVFEVNLTDVTSSTVIRAQCVDAGYVGAFIATLECEGLNYSTTHPLGAGYWRVLNSSDGVTSPLVYNEKTSAPWNQHSDGIARDAHWVWNENTFNTMWFEFSFQPITPITGTVSVHESGSADIGGIIGGVIGAAIILCVIHKHVLSKKQKESAHHAVALQMEVQQKDISRAPGVTEGADSGAPPELPSYDAVVAPPAFTSSAVTAGNEIDGAFTGNRAPVLASESDSVKAFLLNIGAVFCEEYYPLFLNQGFDSMELVRTLSDGDLKEIGICKLGHRRKILMALQ